MRIIFMGSPDFAVPTLEELVAGEHEVVAVYCQPPRPGGRRGRELTPGPVHKAALAMGLEVRHPASLKGAEEQADFAALNADVAVVAAYGLILPAAMLDAPRLGCLNVHASLLPRWRGAAPVQRAILAGDAETGVCIMQMEAGLDTGPVIGRATGVTVADKTCGELTLYLAQTGSELMRATLQMMEMFPLDAKPQDTEGVTYAAKVDKGETRIDFSQSAEQVERQIRAFAPTPGAWCEINGERMKLLACEVVEGSGAPGMVLDEALTLACGTGAIRPSLIQRAGKPVLATADLLRGWPIAAGTLAQ
jgi:methionyl-tRNA formyltransferase